MLRLPLLYLTSASLFVIFFRVRQIGLLTVGLYLEEKGCGRGPMTEDIAVKQTPKGGLEVKNRRVLARVSRKRQNMWLQKSRQQNNAGLNGR